MAVDAMQLAPLVPRSIKYLNAAQCETSCLSPLTQELGGLGGFIFTSSLGQLKEENLREESVYHKRTEKPNRGRCTYVHLDRCENSFEKANFF